MDQAFRAALEAEFGGEYHWIGDALKSKYQTRWRPRSGKIKRYVLHHTGGATTMDGVWRYHVNTLGWDQGGYALGVDSTGHLWHAVPPSIVTYGSGPEYNDTSFYVVALGNLDVARPSAAMLNAIYRVFCVCDDSLGFLPWRGHRELKGTACPGRYLFPHLVTMRGASHGSANPRPPRYP